MAESVIQQLHNRQLVLPPGIAAPAGVTIPFEWTRLHNDRLLASGHGPLTETGAPAGPFGKVPSEVSIEAAQQAAIAALLSLLSSARRTLGDLDRIDAWLSVTVFVNADIGFDRLTLIANPMSQLIIDLFGPDRGAHARTSPGVAELPFRIPVIVNAELAIRA